MRMTRFIIVATPALAEFQSSWRYRFDTSPSAGRGCLDRDQ
jgi:hypothetical protein